MNYGKWWCVIGTQTGEVHVCTRSLGLAAKVWDPGTLLGNGFTEDAAFAAAWLQRKNLLEKYGYPALGPPRQAIGQ